MIAIVNVTKNDNQKLDDYEIRINQKVICSFQHERQFNGAAQCLRDAADALDAGRENYDIEFLKALLPEKIK